MHPDSAGHLVMAFGLLKALGVPPCQLRIDVAMAAKGVSRRMVLRSVASRRWGDGLEVAVKFDRLPFFVEAAARKVLPFLPFQETFNECRLTVRGLRAARGFVWCRGIGSEAIENAMFEDGINLFRPLVQPRICRPRRPFTATRWRRTRSISRCGACWDLIALNSPWYTTNRTGPAFAAFPAWTGGGRSCWCATPWPGGSRWSRRPGLPKRRVISSPGGVSGAFSATVRDRRFGR